jgi:hypothetical protein
MATTRKSARKSAKRTAGKKSRGKGASAQKKATRTKAASRRSGPKAKKAARPRGTSAATLKKRAVEGLRVARGGVETVKQAGDKLWDSLRSTTAQVVEGVRDRLGEDDERSRPPAGR